MIESNSDDNSIQQITQRLQRSNSLREDFNIYRNGSYEPFTNISDNFNNIYNRTNNIDDYFSNQNEIRFHPSISRLFSPPEEYDFYFFDSTSKNIFELYEEKDKKVDDLESEIISSSLPIFSEQNNNRNDLITENQTNYRINIPINNANNSNRNEFNPQNRNTNNNNPNIMNFHFNFPILDFDDSFRYPRINLTAIRNIKKKLTKIRFKKSLSSNGNNEKCTICCEDFKNNQNVYNLPCHHLFHVDCLEQEIKFRQKCSLCRNEL